jgi:hypothetical protein
MEVKMILIARICQYTYYFKLLRLTNQINDNTNIELAFELCNCYKKRPLRKNIAVFNFFYYKCLVLKFSA